METVIKQGEENRARSLSMANRVHEEYLPLKSEIDHMRREYLGLDRLPDLHEEEGNTIAPEYVFIYKLSINFISTHNYIVFFPAVSKIIIPTKLIRHLHQIFHVLRYRHIIRLHKKLLHLYHQLHHLVFCHHHRLVR